MPEKENILADKALDFAVRAVSLFRHLTDNKKEFIISKQIMRSGTSIGANIAEAQGAQSTADFIARLHIALKECYETLFWIKLLHRTELLTDKEAKSLKKDLSEITALLVAIIKSAKQQMP